MGFIVLPDHPEAASAAGWGRRSVTHHSGRPWLLGDWEPDELTLLTAGANQLAVFGHTRIDHERVTRALAAARSPRDLDAVLLSLPGCLHVVASVAGEVRAQGSLSTARQLFVTRIRGCAVAADNPAPLTRLVGATVDEAALAVRLLFPGAPWPLSERTVWEGVTAVAVGHWLRLDRDGRATEVGWWSPRRTDLPLAEAADAVRAALVEATGLRTAGNAVVSADLSGGLDSTSLCFLAARDKPDLVTFHVTPLDQANPDSRWARRAAEALPHGRHHTISAQREASWFDADPDVQRATDSGEGPSLWGAGGAHLIDLSTAAAAAGSTVHLMGLGGDELFGSVPAHLWSLWRSRPLASLPTIRRRQLLNRWRLGAVLRELADRADFATALATTAGQLTTPLPPPPVLSLRWVSGLRLPRWATPKARELVRDLITRTVDAGVDPLDPDRVRHQILESVVREGTLIRQNRQGLAATGVRWDAPMLDDRVVEAALSVRIEDRALRGRFKPLLTTAMRGIVPDDVLARRDKGEFSAEMYRGLRHNRAGFLALCEDSRLAALGLVDVDVLRSALRTPHPETRQVIPLEHTVTCETWLRSRDTVPNPMGARL